MPLATIPHHHCTKCSGHILSREATTKMQLIATSDHDYTKYNDHNPPTEANTVRPPVAILQKFRAMYGKNSTHTLLIVTIATRILAAFLHYHDASHGATIK